MSAYNVLICDDDADIVNALKIYLQTEDYGIFCAASGKEALECIHNHDIHLVLLDELKSDTGKLACKLFYLLF